MNGLIKTKSKYNFEVTVDKILESFKSNKIAVFTTIDHEKNAEGVNLKMNPEKVILFGSPIVGTPLMVENPDIGIELPSKLLVYERDNDTYVIYKDPEAIIKDYDIENYKDNLIKLKTLIESIIKQLNNVS